MNLFKWRVFDCALDATLQTCSFGESVNGNSVSVIYGLSGFGQREGKDELSFHMSYTIQRKRCHTKIYHLKIMLFFVREELEWGQKIDNKTQKKKEKISFLINFIVEKLQYFFLVGSENSKTFENSCEAFSEPMNCSTWRINCKGFEKSDSSKQ